MGILESLQSVRAYLFAAVNGSSRMRKAVDDASAITRIHRPFGPEAAPRGLPPDIPVYSQRGFRHRPLASVSPQGDVCLTYAPREDFEVVVSFYEEQLALRRWLISEVCEDNGPRFRARRYEVQKGLRQGTISVEETVEDLGPLVRSLVTVSIDIPCWQ